MIRKACFALVATAATFQGAVAQQTTVTRNADAANKSVGPMTTAPTTVAPSPDGRTVREVPTPTLPARQSNTGGGIDGGT